MNNEELKKQINELNKLEQYYLLGYLQGMLGEEK